MARQTPEAKKRSHDKYYHANKEKAHAAVAKLRHDKKIWLRELKERNPCADCGKKYPYYIMDFDHLDGEEKKFALARGAAGMSWEDVELEVAKCEIVCANCHRVRTHKRRHEDN